MSDETERRDPPAWSELRLDECYREGGQRQFERGWPESLRKSLSHCHDVNRVIIRENDKLRQRIATLSTRLWIVSGALGFTATVLAGIVVLLFENR